MSTSSLRRSLVPLVLVLAVAACGNDGSSTGSSSDPSESASTSASASASASVSPSAAAGDEPTAEEVAAAGRINLKAADLGAGFTGTPPEPEDDTTADEEFAQQVFTCVGKAPAEPPDDDDDIAGEDITNADEAEISSSVDFYATAEDAKTEFSIFTSPKILECLQAGFAKALNAELAETGGTVSNVKFVDRNQLEVLPDVAAFRLTATLTVQQQSIDVTGDFVAILRGNIGISVESFAAGPPLSDAVVTKAIRAVATRAEAEAS